MTTENHYPRPEHFGEATVPAFGYELIRNQLLPELLGDECASILYWSGRKIARHYLMDSENQLDRFFDWAGWGELSLVEKSKKKMIFECHSPMIEARIKEHPNTTVFTLEAGFIAEQIQHILGCTAEAYTEIRNGRSKKVVFLIKWDMKDPVDE